MNPEVLHDFLHRRIDCPLAWCGGQWAEHGGDGGAPETWLHNSADVIELPHDGALSRSQEGAGPSVWSLFMGQSIAIEVDTLQGIAVQLRAIANAVERVTD